MCDYLDENRSVFAFRRAVPQELQPFIFTKTGKPRTEWRYSLRTTDRRLATERCRVEAVVTDRVLEKARAERAAWLVSTAKSPAEKDRERLEAEYLAEASELAWQEEMREDWAFDERSPIRQAIIAKLSRPRSDFSAAEAAMRDLIPDVEFDPPEVRDARQRKIEADWKAGAEEPGDWLPSLQGHVAAPPAHRSLLDLFESYSAEAGHGPATHKRWQPVIRSLIAHVGHDDPSRFTREDILSWKQALQQEKGKDGSPARGASTIREVYLAAVKATLEWGVQNGWLSESPAEKVTVRVPKKVRLRDPDFTDAEAKLILRSTREPQGASLAPEHALARRWVPWVCAYTGARVNEITQMRAEDVRQVGGIWTIRITPEAGSQKQGTARVAPLHSHLVEQGFPEVAAKIGKGPMFYDPARSRGGKAANPHYKKVGERLASWVRRIGVDDQDVQPNHGWRHLFKSRARNCGMDIDAREAIPGHEPGTEGRKYGVNDVPFLAAEIEKLPRFEV